ncbi:hypothetical protein HY406_01090 [Candidatus Giovannonibacteria bacterium]|nr:hypothetical protein [Candidatus Giovannonibacteria bacterium]
METSNHTQDIFFDPDVYKPPIGDIATPIFSDVRGTIQRIEIASQKINLLYTKKGFMRSGDLHKNTQFDFVFKGQLELWLRRNNQDIKQIYGPNSFVEIEPGIPHLFKFLEDTLMAEWWNGPFEAWYYRPYREIIEAEFEKMAEARKKS